MVGRLWGPEIVRALAAWGHSWVPSPTQCFCHPQGDLVWLRCWVPGSPRFAFLIETHVGPQGSSVFLLSQFHRWKTDHSLWLSDLCAAYFRCYLSIHQIPESLCQTFQEILWGPLLLGLIRGGGTSCPPRRGSEQVASPLSPEKSALPSG